MSRQAKNSRFGDVAERKPSLESPGEPRQSQNQLEVRPQPCAPEIRLRIQTLQAVKDLEEVLARDIGPWRDHGPEFWDEVKSWWYIELLRDAAKEGDREGFKRLLWLFLYLLEAPVPEGVLESFKWARGRPQETENVFLDWVTRGRPPVNVTLLDEMAKIHYPEEWKQAKSDTNLRRKLRNRSGPQSSATAPRLRNPRQFRSVILQLLNHRMFS